LSFLKKAVKNGCKKIKIESVFQKIFGAFCTPKKHQKKRPPLFAGEESPRVAGDTGIVLFVYPKKNQ
jgi:alkanesulfonate monooxygenase SsuD/methylene tetrahydromethanopterin reductase-like flavin-dependent oxidoreductase (luciferase family)